MDVAALRESIRIATEEGGAFGKNLHETKDVVLDIDGVQRGLESVSVSFVDGAFVLKLTGAASAEAAS